MNLERALRVILPEHALEVKAAFKLLSQHRVFEAMQRELREQCLDSFKLVDDKAAVVLKECAVIENFLAQLQDAAGGFSIAEVEDGERQ